MLNIGKFILYCIQIIYFNPTNTKMKTSKFVISIFCLLVQVTSKAQVSTYFSVETDFPNNNGKYSADIAKLPAYSEAHIQSAFSALANSGIYFGYPQGGCQNRAEMMHILLEKELCMQHAKVWIFAPMDLYPGDNRKLEIKDPNNLAANGMIMWTYHVAPVLIRKNADGKLDTVVIDPAIDNKKPMVLKDWLGSMKNANVSKYTFLESKWYFFNTQNNSSVINGFFYPYTTDVFEDYHRSTVERGLAVNDMAKFLLKKLKDGYNDSNGDLKKFVTNQDNMYNFFMNPYWDLNGSRASLLKNNSKLMREVEQYYWERVALWQAKVNQLHDTQCP